MTDLGGSTPISEVAIEGDNWMSALKAGRAEIGEEGGVPTGASCAVAPDGKVTILDPMERRRYVLTPDTSTSFQRAKPHGPRIPAEDAARPPAEAEADEPPAGADAAQEQGTAEAPPAQQASGEPPAAGPAAGAPGGKPSKKTVAYMPSPLAAQPSGAGEVAVGGEPPAAEATGGAPAEPAGSPPAEPQGAEAQHAEPQSAEPAPSAESPSAEVQPAPPWEQLSGRDRDPSDDNPLRYRERTYVVPEGTPADTAESVLRARFEELRQELQDQPAGKFFNLAIFDHRWEGKPERPPLVTLQWKDWRGDPEVGRPLEQSRASQPAPASGPAPAAGAEPPARRRRTSTDENDARLAHAFEACQDLLFLGTPVEGLEFVVRLVGELVPSEVITGALYDINTHELRMVTLTGPGSEERQGEAIPSSAGLFGAVTERTTTPLRIDDVEQDGRFDPGVDGRPGLEARNALYVPLSHHGRLLGVLQLLNNQRGDSFTDHDAHLLAYIGGQLAEFLHGARIKADPALAKG